MVFNSSKLFMSANFETSYYMTEVMNTIVIGHPCLPTPASDGLTVQ